MKVFEKPKELSDITQHYCPGCSPGIEHQLVAQALDELGFCGLALGVAPVDCGVLAYNYFNCAMP